MGIGVYVEVYAADTSEAADTLERITKQVREGYSSGADRNATGSYWFNTETTDDAEDDSEQ